MMANLPTPLRGPRGLVAGAVLIIAPRLLGLPRSMRLLARFAGIILAAAAAADDRVRSALPGDQDRGKAGSASPPATTRARSGAPGRSADAEVIPQRMHADDELVAEEESAAAAAARAIGGPALNDADDPAMDPVYEAGGGEAEGYELAERELIRNATHDIGRADPEGDSYIVEAEIERSTAEYGEPDQIRSIEGDQSGTGQDEGPDRADRLYPPDLPERGRD